MFSSLERRDEREMTSPAASLLLASLVMTLPLLPSSILKTFQVLLLCCLTVPALTDAAAPSVRKLEKIFPGELGSSNRAKIFLISRLRSGRETPPSPTCRVCRGKPRVCSCYTYRR